ncbi:MAG: hypothetical protein FWE80_08460 [Oscillospiraceae bacterium]|nr:hypothetical protein [Oscillospiraceae bacterium]
MRELQISPAFTVEDIHKVREWNYERRKGMTDEEVIADTRKGADAVLKRIEALRRTRAAN